MKKILTVLTILISSQFLTFKVFAGSDGTVDNVFFEAGNGITLVDQGTNTVSISAVNNGGTYVSDTIDPTE